MGRDPVAPFLSFLSKQICSIKVNPGTCRCQACLKNYTIWTPASTRTCDSDVAFRRQCRGRLGPHSRGLHLRFIFSDNRLASRLQSPQHAGSSSFRPNRLSVSPTSTGPHEPARREKQGSRCLTVEQSVTELQWARNVRQGSDELSYYSRKTPENALSQPVPSSSAMVGGKRYIGSGMAMDSGCGRGMEVIRWRHSAPARGACAPKPSVFP